MNSTIQIRVDKKTKNKARRVFKSMGLDMSSAVKLYLQNVINNETLPFVPRTENGFTPAQENKMLREVEEALDHGKRYKNIQELHSDL